MRETNYVIVDKDGDQIARQMFKPDVDIPVHVQSVKFTLEGDITITLRYEDYVTWG